NAPPAQRVRDEGAVEIEGLLAEVHIRQVRPLPIDHQFELVGCLVVMNREWAFHEYLLSHAWACVGLPYRHGHTRTAHSSRGARRSADRRWSSLTPAWGPLRRCMIARTARV